MKPNKTLAQQIVERESLKIQLNPPITPPAYKHTPKLVVEKAIIQHLEQFIQTILTSNRFEGELLNLSHESVLKEIREIIETLREEFKRKWKDERK